MSLLDRLTGREKRPNPPWKGVEGPRHEGTLLEAVLAAEGALADRVVVSRAVKEGGGSVIREDSTAAAISVATGFALSGLRTTAVGEVGEGTAEHLRAASRLHAPLVFHALVRDERDLDLLGASGAPVALARDGAHALDLLLVARRLAETALSPVVVAIEDPGVARVDEARRLLPSGLISEFLGEASAEETPPTPAQRILFGESRRRVPRWFDPERPVLLGAEIPEDLRAPWRAGRALFFDAAVPGLLDEAEERFRESTGRTAGVLLRKPAGIPDPPVEPPPAEPPRSAFPRREALLQQVRRDYPEAARFAPPAAPTAPAAARPDEIPLAVRRLGRVGRRYDNISRFWGENAEPILAGDPAARALDPFLALGAIPPYASTLFPVEPAEATLPVLDPDRCTGCGVCWSACPDAAILATAAPFASLLEAAAERAARATETAAASLSRLKRTFKAVASLLEAGVAKEGAARRVVPARLENAWGAFAAKGLPEGEREALGAAFSAAAAEVRDLPLLAATRLHATPLLLAFDPRTCRACGICATECHEEAIRLEPRTPERLDEARRAIAFWEGLPDTPGTIVAKAARDPEVGPLAGTLLARSAALALGGGGEGMPGSGTRLAARQVLALLEAERQLALSSRLDGLTTLAQKLRGAIGEEFTRAATPADLAAFEGAVAEIATKQAPVAEILARLEAAGERHAVDRDRLARLAHAAREIETLRLSIADGSARFGVVALEGGPVWGTRFPGNPFGVPAVVASPESAASLATGLARAFLDRAAHEARTVRSAVAALEGATEIGPLDVSDLTGEERGAALPVVLLATESALSSSSAAAMVRTLDSGLPIRVVLLHDVEPPERVTGIVPFAAPPEGAWSGWGTPGEGARLAEAVVSAARARGPSLLRVLAPEPGGLSPDTTLALAGDPARSGALSRWAALEGPFGDRIREVAKREAAKTREREVAAARAAAESEAAEAARSRASTDAAWLKRRLLELAGFGTGRSS